MINVFMRPTFGAAMSAESIETEHGCNVEHLTVAGMHCWVVSDLNKQELASSRACCAQRRSL